MQAEDEITSGEDWTGAGAPLPESYNSRGDFMIVLRIRIRRVVINEA